MAYSLRDSYGIKHPIGFKCQVGRDPGNQIVLLDPQVAPLHATLWEQEGILYLQDGSGGNATFVNQARIQGTVALRVGDQVVFGSTPYLVDDLTAPQPGFAPAITSQPATAPFSTPVSTPKKRKGCGAWILTALLVFVSECVLIVAAALILASADVELKGGIQDLKALLTTSESSFEPPTDINQAGPAVIALSDTFLTLNYTDSFTQNQTRTAEGISPSGTQSTASFQSEYIQQMLPLWTSYTKVSQTANDAIVFQYEYGTVNNIKYSNENNSCSAIPDSNDGLHASDQTAYSLLTSELTGHVKLVEEGVMIDGVMADRYALRMDNFSNAETVLELISGDLYRAREGGYLLQLDYVIKIQPRSWIIAMGEDFSTTESAQVTYHFDRTYAPNESLSVQMPEVCASQIP